MTTLKVGDAAPLFTLKNQNEEDISLSILKGKNHVVLYFYPKAMTPGCTLQAQGLRDKKRTLSSQKATVLGISPDAPSRLAKFIERDNLNFDLLSDHDHRVSEQYGVWGLKKFMGREYMGILRTTFIIGKDGKIKHIIDKVNTKTHHHDVVELLESL